MFTTTVFALIAALPVALSQTQNDETIFGVYMLHRHGDRTAKITAPANLTDLGYRQVYTSGEYYRNRYIVEDSAYRISGISPDVVFQSQLQVSAPIDAVLQNSATGFLQALYPPVGTSANTETLRNGTEVTAPMEGYQLVPIGVAESGSGSEDSTWLQGTSDCARAEISSNEYFSSDEFNEMMSQTEDFYSRLLPVISGEFDETTANFEDAYTSEYSEWLAEKIKANMYYQSSTSSTSPQSIMLRSRVQTYLTRKHSSSSARWQITTNGTSRTTPPIRFVPWLA